MRFDSVDRGRLILAVVAVFVLLALLVVASRDDATSSPPAINGDMLGQDGESFGEYVQRARSTVDAAPEEENAFALVTFAEPLTAGQAAEVTGGLGRVNAMIVGISPPMALPEPIAGENREDVYIRQFELVAHSLRGIGDLPVPYQLTSVIAWDDPVAFRSVASDPRVTAVEMLPPDARWGDFGVRPVEVPGMNMLSVAVPAA